MSNQLNSGLPVVGLASTHPVSDGGDGPSLTKMCPNCKTIKPINSFYFRKNKKQLTAYCKECSRIRWSKWNEKRKENFKIGIIGDDSKKRGPKTSLVGMTFGKWKVLSLVQIYKSPKTGTRRGYEWLCQCCCGEKKVIPSGNLTSRKTTMCNLCASKKRRMIMTPTNLIYRSYATSARTRSLPISLSPEDVFLMSQKECHYCGAGPSNTLKWNKGSKNGERSIKYNGIDRIDNKKGYVSGNVVPCCCWCNKRKLNDSVSGFSEWIKRVYNHWAIKEC